MSMHYKAASKPNAHRTQSRPSSSLSVADLRLLLELLLLAQRLHLAIVLLGDLAAVQADFVPGQVEELVDALEAAAGGFGDAEPDPDGAEDGDDTVRKCVSCLVRSLVVVLAAAYPKK